MQAVSGKKRKRKMLPKWKSVKMVVNAHSAFASEQSETELWLPALEFQASFTADDGIINRKCLRKTSNICPATCSRSGGTRKEVVEHEVDFNNCYTVTFVSMKFTLLLWCVANCLPA